MPKDEPTNALYQPPPGPGAVNALRSFVGDPAGTAEYIKAYAHQFGTGRGDYTEQNLSPQGLENIRQMAAMNYHNPRNADSMTQYPGNYGDPGDMANVLGRVAPGNIRQVNIGGVPYWHVLDRYDFNYAKERIDQGKYGEVLKETLGDLTHGRTYNAERNIPSLLGLGYNVNMLVPVDAKRQADPRMVEAFRSQSQNRLPYPNNTLGGKAVNALINSPQTPGQSYEKAMP